MARTHKTVSVGDVLMVTAVVIILLFVFGLASCNITVTPKAQSQSVTS